MIALVLHELRRVGSVPLRIALPDVEPLRRLCRAYLDSPDVAVTNAGSARAAACSERTLDRRFRDSTRVAPGVWRTRARLLAGQGMLQRRFVTEVAASLGYSTPAVFTHAFGRPPTRYRWRGSTIVGDEDPSGQGRHANTLCT